MGQHAAHTAAGGRDPQQARQGGCKVLYADGFRITAGLDPRTLAPLDVDTILKSVKKTGRLLLVDQGTRHGSAAAIIAAEVAERGFESLKAPLRMVTALDTSVPYSEPMENYILPNEDKIVSAVKSVLAGQEVAA